jgi:hypothetical protein
MVCSYAFKNLEDNDFLVSFHSLNTSVMSVEIFHSKEDKRDCLFMCTFLLLIFRVVGMYNNRWWHCSSYNRELHHSSFHLPMMYINKLGYVHIAYAFWCVLSAVVSVWECSHVSISERLFIPPRPRPLTISNCTSDDRVVWGQRPCVNGMSGTCLAGLWRHLRGFLRMATWTECLPPVWLGIPPRGFKVTPLAETHVGFCVKCPLLPDFKWHSNVWTNIRKTPQNQI